MRTGKNEDILSCLFFFPVDPVFQTQPIKRTFMIIMKFLLHAHHHFRLTGKRGALRAPAISISQDIGKQKWQQSVGRSQPVHYISIWAFLAWRSAMIMAAQRGNSLDGWSCFNLRMADLCDLVRRCPRSGWLTRFPAGTAHSLEHNSPLMQWESVGKTKMRQAACRAHFSESDTREDEAAVQRCKIKSGTVRQK